jgi:propanediol dehydratase small subunit
MPDDTVRTQSGRTLDELDMQALLSGELSTEDFRISGETLRRQADAAAAAGYRQFADNLRRAAELTRISNKEVLDLYNALRPGRKTYPELLDIAEHLESDCEAPLTAALVRQAAAAYRERGITKQRQG